jgi:chromate reductase
VPDPAARLRTSLAKKKRNGFGSIVSAANRVANLCTDSPSAARHFIQEINMSQYPIAVVVGSLRRDSINRKLATALAQLAPPEFSFKQIGIGDLPLYNQDDDANQAEPVKRLKGQIETARGLLFVTAEYNRSIPGVLKNAIDHASRPYGENVWQGKPAGVLGASIGAIGTAAAQQHLRTVLAYLDVLTLGQPEVFIHAKEGLFDPSGNIGADSRKFLQDWMDRYVAWVRKHAGQ